MVEIEVYSTVGTSEVICRHYAECRREVRQRRGESLWQRLKKGVENGVKDVVKMVVFCTLQNSHARRPVNFWYNCLRRRLKT